MSVVLGAVAAYLALWSWADRRWPGTTTAASTTWDALGHDGGVATDARH